MAHGVANLYGADCMNGIQTPKPFPPTPFEYGPSLHPKNLATYAFLPVSFEFQSEPGSEDKTRE